MESWKTARGMFAAVATVPTLWLLGFFIIPLRIVWLYSFGTNTSLTEIEISGTFSNYARALDPLYLGILWKSILVAAATTVASQVLPVAASTKDA